MYSNLHQRSSSPIKDHNATFIMKDFPADMSFPDNLLLRTGDSTRSLLTPLYASDYESFELYEPEDTPRFKELPKSALERDINDNDENNNSQPSSLVNESEQHSSNSSGKSKASFHSRSSSSSSISSSSSSSSTSKSSSKSPSSSGERSLVLGNNSKVKSWDQWILEKTLQDMHKLKIKQEEKKKRDTEKRMTAKEKMRKEKLAENNREEWLQKKSFEAEKKRKEKAAQIEFVNLKKRQERELIENKAKENYAEWCQQKIDADGERRQKVAEERLKASKEIISKKTSSKEAYTTWLKKAKKKQRHNRNTYGYSGGCLFSYYDMGSNPPPSFVNPVPWVGIDCSHKINSENELFSSPPLLWKDVENRAKPPKRRTKPKRVVSKHSCVDIS